MQLFLRGWGIPGCWGLGGAVEHRATRRARSPGALHTRCCRQAQLPALVPAPCTGGCIQPSMVRCALPANSSLD